MSDAKQQPAAKTPAQTTLDAVRAWYDEHDRKLAAILTDKRGEFSADKKPEVVDPANTPTM